ncbi:MAG TPA: hypothetical protein VLL52_16835 [Anaerolineae bacterium]|nr:hypothetical protein [Anaerolineae bacterium]
MMRRLFRLVAMVMMVCLWGGVGGAEANNGYHVELLRWEHNQFSGLNRVLVAVTYPGNNNGTPNMTLQTNFMHQIITHTDWSDCVGSNGHTCQTAYIYFDGHNLNFDGQQFTVTANWSNVSVADQDTLLPHYINFPSPDACGMTGCS